MTPVCAKPLRGRSVPATGTDAGYQRHWRARERPCEPCAAAHRRHVSDGQSRRPEAHRRANRRWRDANPGYFTRRQRERLAVDVEHRLTRALRKRLWAAVRGAARAESTVELVGCTVAELREHLEALFTVGMMWDNYGARGWEVDHVVPIAAFDMSDPEQRRACFHYTNLQPLWAVDNRRKGKRTLRAS